MKARLVVPSAVVGVGLIAAVTVVAVTNTKPTASRGEATKSITFAGYEADVPASWPVYDLRTDPKRCVRFDQHAVYLGTPSRDQNCPAHAVGRTEALLVEPLSTAAPNPTSTGELRSNLADAQVTVTASYLDNQTLAASFVATDPQKRVWRRVPVQPTATASTTASPSGGSSGTAPGSSTPSSSDTPAPSQEPTATVDPSPSTTPSEAPEPTGTPSSSDTPTPSAEPTTSPTPSDEPTATPSEQPTASAEPSATPTGEPTTSAAPTATTAPEPSPTLTPSPTPSPTNSDGTPTPSPTASLTTLPGPRVTARPGSPYTVPKALLTNGLGFDTCEAPSLTAMNAWAPTQLNTLGIYVGGANRACKNVNLTASWVSSVNALGYTFLPTYVGLQAPCITRSLGKIDPKQAASQGSAAAADAIAQMARLGLGRGNPIYLDIEHYTGDAACTAAVLNYTTGFVQRAHADGYGAGVYSNASSGIHDLGANVSSEQYTSPDTVWFARWNNLQDVDSMPYVPNNLWAGRRSKQYDGDHVENHGGVSINIDSNFLAGVTARPGNF